VRERTKRAAQAFRKPNDRCEANNQREKTLLRGKKKRAKGRAVPKGKEPFDTYEVGNSRGMS